VDAINDLRADSTYLIHGLTTFVRTLKPVQQRDAHGDQQQALIELGVFTAETLAETQREVDRGALQLDAAESWLVAALETVSLQSIANFLHRTEDEIRQAVAERKLMAVDIAGQLRFPAWQLNSRPVGRTPPYLETLLPSMERRWDWMTMGRFFATRQEDLVGEGRKTPAAWREDGGNPETVKRIIESDPFP
jgi:hypothetical protein